MKKFIIEVRPKLLEDKRAAVNGHVSDPTLISLGEGALLAGIVKVGNSRRSTRSEYFGGTQFR